MRLSVAANFTVEDTRSDRLRHSAGSVQREALGLHDDADFVDGVNTPRGREQVERIQEQEQNESGAQGQARCWRAQHRLSRFYADKRREVKSRGEYLARHSRGFVGLGKKFPGTGKRDLTSPARLSFELDTSY